MKKEFADFRKLWQSDGPVSTGATAYHDAVIGASWHIDNIRHLIQIMKPHVREGHTVVDFGAGTGSSAFYFRKYLPKKTKFLLVDNSASWLGHAYKLLGSDSNIACVLLKNGDRYMFLDEVIGEATADHIVCANTIHLMTKLNETLGGIRKALKPGGTFSFQSGNIARKARKNGVLMIHNTVDRVHDIAITMIQEEEKYARYRRDLPVRIERELSQRKFVFPDPKPIEFYKALLESTGFHDLRTVYKRIRVNFTDWLQFLRVRRLQAGILPEVGGKDPSPREELDRDTLITAASQMLFQELSVSNPLADRSSFVAEWIYVSTKK